MNIYRKDYSSIIVYLSIFFSFITLITLYLDSNYYWTLFGINITIASCCYFFTSSKIFNFILSIIRDSFISKIILLINSFTFFLSSSYGLFIFIDITKLSSYSDIYIPFILLVILFLATSLGLHRPYITW